MAFAVVLEELTEALVTATASDSTQSETKRLEVLKGYALRRLRHHDFLQTNQFDVEKRLNGLEEHFRVLNRDGLADALGESLDALSEISNRFTPDILHFLLELSDQPVQKSKLADLELLREPKAEHALELRWEDIAKEDQWTSDQELWKNVDFADDSSDDVLLDDESGTSARFEETSESSIEAQYRRQPTDFLINPPDGKLLEDILETQSWRRAVPLKTSSNRNHVTEISELQAVREVLFMINGLRNDFFDPASKPLATYKLKHVSQDAYRALLSSLGEDGRHLSVLRSFARQPQTISLMQVFQDAVEKRLREFDATIARIQKRFLDIKENVVVSLIDISNEINPHLQPLTSLSEIIQRLQLDGQAYSFRYLELLFDAASVSQFEGNHLTYQFLANIFFECFQVYLRYIRRWMDEGELSDEDETFFISASRTHRPKSQIWQDGYILRRKPDATVYAPNFLHPAASKIFTTGKSVVILKLLGKYNTSGVHTTEPDLYFEFLKGAEFGSLVPFSEAFRAVFEQWMQSKHHAASATLRHVLFDYSGLSSVLQALQRVYLMSDGARADSFASAVFTNLDLLNSKWNDHFVLTEQAHEAFSILEDPHRLTVSAAWDDTLGDVGKARKSIRNGLAAIRMTYRITWLHRIVLSDESLEHYQSVFAFLLQLRRASSILRKYRLLADMATNRSSEQSMFYNTRSRLLWFCNALQTYLSDLVLQPLVSELEENLRLAEDVDAMAAVHSTFAKRMLDEACLGSRLDPIHQSTLDTLDLAIRLEDARQLDQERRLEEASAVPRQGKAARARFRDRYLEVIEEEDESFLLEQDKSVMFMEEEEEKTYGQLLRGIRNDFERHLKFICGGLRGVARASSDAAAGKWDTLAEMLEAGIQETSFIHESSW